MSDPLQRAEDRVRLAEGKRAGVEHAYRQTIKLDRPNAERVAAYDKLKTARWKEQVARIKFTKLLQKKTSISLLWGAISEVDLFEACAQAVGEVVGAEARGVRNALRLARKSLERGDGLGNAEQCEAYAYLFEHVLQDVRGFFLFVDACEKLARSWADGPIGSGTIKGQTAAILKIYRPDISEIFVKRKAEYQKRKVAGRKALFGMGT